MKYILNVIFYCYLVWAFCVVVLNFKANITFGKGLGDIIYLIVLVVVSIILSVAFFKIKKKYTENIFALLLLCIIMLLTIIFFLLKLTIWRGAEYIWNGNIFLE